MSNTKGENGVRQDNLSFGLNEFKLGTRGYSPEAREELEWFWGYIHDQLGASQINIEKATKLSYEAVRLAMTGRADEAELIPVLQAVERLRASELKGSGIVETVVTREIATALNYARENHAMVAITGPTGRSKTETAKAWARANNHGRARYIRIPSNCTRRTLAQWLCKSLGIGINHRGTPEMEMRIHGALSEENILVIDEAGHLIPRSGRGAIAIELLRDLHDMTGCAVALIFTDVYLSEMRAGNLADYFEQFIGRIKLEVTIPREVKQEEVAAVVAAFQPLPTQAMVDQALTIANNNDGKLRTLFEDLKRAKGWAEVNNKQFDHKALALAAKWRMAHGALS